MTPRKPIVCPAIVAGDRVRKTGCQPNDRRCKHRIGTVVNTRRTEFTVLARVHWDGTNYRDTLSVDWLERVVEAPSQDLKRPDDSPAPEPPRRADGPRERWRYATDPDVIENVLPVNPDFIDCADAPQEGT